MPRRAILLFVALLVLGATAPGCSDEEAAEATRIVATTTVLGDVATAVAGTDAEVQVLMPPRVDPHDFTLSARQAAALRSADLVIANGLGLEEGMQDALEQAVQDGADLLYLAPRLEPLPFAGHGDHAVDADHDEEGEDAEGLDPHVWLDPLRMATAARIVAAELEQRFPGRDWTTRAEAYAAELESVDATIRQLLDDLPAERRKLITNHDALGYFAARYGFEVVGTVIPGGSTLAEPSAAALGELVELLEELDIPAIFADVEDPSALADAVAAETEGVLVVELYTGSLGEPGSGAERLPAMLLLNARRIASALSS